MSRRVLNKKKIIIFCVILSAVQWSEQWSFRKILEKITNPAFKIKFKLFPGNEMWHPPVKKEVKKLVIVHSVSAVHFMHWKWNNSKGNIVGQDKIGFQYLFTERQKKKKKTLSLFWQYKTFVRFRILFYLDISDLELVKWFLRVFRFLMYFSHSNKLCYGGRKSRQLL